MKHSKMQSNDTNSDAPKCPNLVEALRRMPKMAPCAILHMAIHMWQHMTMAIMYVGFLIRTIHMILTTLYLLKSINPMKL